MFAIEERLFFSKLLLLFLSLSIWFVFSFFHMGENCVKLFLTMSQIVFQQEMFFEKQENKKVKHTKQKKQKQKRKNYTEIMIILSYVRKEQQLNLGHIMWIALRFLWDSIQRDVGVGVACAHRGVYPTKGGNRTLTPLASLTSNTPKNSPRTHIASRLAFRARCGESESKNL